jgi:hypothetical protein
MARYAVKSFLQTDLLETALLADSAALSLREEYLSLQRAYLDQNPAQQEFLNMQANRIAAALWEKKNRVSFNLPPEVQLRIAPEGGQLALAVPDAYRRQFISAPVIWRGEQDLRGGLRRRFSQLEQSTYPAVASAASLLRFAVARTLVAQSLPGGRWGADLSAAAEVAPESKMDGSIRDISSAGSDTEARIAALRTVLSGLGLAIALAPCFYADDSYRASRAGLLAQLVLQGRALATNQAAQMIDKIRRWAAAHQLDRGLQLSVPYFDDQTLELDLYPMDVIPAGRTPFVPAFVVLAAQRAMAQVGEDQKFDIATRVHLLGQLRMLERAFSPVGMEAESRKADS